MFPIDLDHVVQLGIHGECTVEQALDSLRIQLPYHLRYGFKAILAESTLELPIGPTSAREVVRLIMLALPPGWQSTALAGRIIVYEEHDDSYPGEIIARS